MTEQITEEQFDERTKEYRDKARNMSIEEIREYFKSLYVYRNQDLLSIRENLIVDMLFDLTDRVLDLENKINDGLFPQLSKDYLPDWLTIDESGRVTRKDDTNQNPNKLSDTTVSSTKVNDNRQDPVTGPDETQLIAAVPPKEKEEWNSEYLGKFCVGAINTFLPRKPVVVDIQIYIDGKKVEVASKKIKDLLES